MPDTPLTILTYHAVDARDSVLSTAPATFRRQAERLAARGWRGISLAEAFERRRQDGVFPNDAVVLTFDDAYRSVRQHAAPVLRDLGFSATVFVTTDLVGLDAAAAQGVNRDLDRDIMDWRELQRLRDQGFEIGAHSKTHPDLTRIAPARLEEELAGCKQALETALQVPVSAFAYPYGHVNEAVRNLTAAHYARACTTALGHNSGRADPFRLKRIDAFFLRRIEVFERACRGGLAWWWPVHQALRDLRGR